MVAKLNGLFFSEFVVDNPTEDPGYDTDNDGIHNKSDEYIEIQNTSGGPMSLDGYEVWSDAGGLLYAFGPGDTIASGETAVIIGEYTGGAPAGYYDAGLADGDDFLPDGEGPRFDSIYLVDTDTGEYIVFSYGDPVQPSSPPVGFTGTTLVAADQYISDGPNGTAFVRDANADWTDGPYTPGTPGVPCFTTGTMILTPEGERPVESLQVGDMVLTHSSGPQPIRWVAQRTLSAKDLAARPELCPIHLHKKFTKAACDMLLSPQHAVLVKSARYPGGCLVRAIQLARMKGGAVRVATGTSEVTYVHFMLPQHELVYANGLAVESFYPGTWAIQALSPSARLSLSAQFPGLDDSDFAASYGDPCVPYVRSADLPKRLNALSVFRATAHAPKIAA